MQDKTLERVESIRDLRMLFDKKLTFSDHISATTAKAFAMLGFIWRNAANFDDFDSILCVNSQCSGVRGTSLGSIPRRAAGSIRACTKVLR